ncbi:MAG: Asp-tRNA(Asn)/Glu-tRNA(Gln) amidotransferase subunit GatC [Chitinophagaceae bacterium]
MQIRDHKKAIEFILHPNIIANGPKITTEMKVTCWPDTTHYYIIAFIHKDGEDKHCVRMKEIRQCCNWYQTLTNATYFCRMEVTNQLIDKLADLGRLSFNDEEKAALKIDLEKMIGFIDKLNELDTSGIEPLLHLSDNLNVLREDNVRNMISRVDALKNAPIKDDSFFKVPKVIRKQLPPVQ